VVCGETCSSDDGRINNTGGSRRVSGYSYVGGHSTNVLGSEEIDERLMVEDGEAALFFCRVRGTVIF
jgi:hypothetical protein